MSDNKKILHLKLTKRWFDMILCGKKKEEYRDDVDYWLKRLCNAHIGCIGGDFMNQHKVISYTFKHFDIVCFRNGYAKNAPEIQIECLGIGKGWANPDWSSPMDRQCFIIKLGEIISTANIKL